MNDNPINLLLVEDDDTDAEFIKRSLKGHKETINIIWCKNGAEAIHYLESNICNLEVTPVVTLLDLKMPVMTGFEFLSKIRQDDLYKKLVVFVLSSSNHWDDINTAYNHNIAGYLQKRKVSHDPQSLVDLLLYYKNQVQFPPSITNLY
ncbi:MAG: two-component system response regulator [Verrucomicrobiales bacterium]|nr:two-component system response regulator [Verrucomicrobiales bacterium]|tara:strand:+ start:3143 stop:3586 length:444 start_codon:yes stop_codon:yes gene_type:complete